MYEIIFYDTADGKCPVQDFLDSLEPKFLAKTLRTIDLLETNGPLLREPYSKPLENGILKYSIVFTQWDASVRSRRTQCRLN